MADSSGRPVLLLIDGTDLVGDATGWFGPGKWPLGGLAASVVFTAPHAWCLTSGPGDRDERINAVWHLPPFPVIDEGGGPAPRVITHLADGLRRRLGDADLLEEPTLMDRIVRSSGGVPRHAVILLRESILAAAGQDQLRIAHVLDAERELRQDLLHTVRASGRPTPAMHVSGALLSYEGPTRRFQVEHPLLAT